MHKLANIENHQSDFDWCAVGSNQHKRKQHQGSPKECAAASKKLIEKAMA